MLSSGLRDSALRADRNTLPGHATNVYLELLGFMNWHEFKIDQLSVFCQIEDLDGQDYRRLTPGRLWRSFHRPTHFYQPCHKTMVVDSKVHQPPDGRKMHCMSGVTNHRFKQTNPPTHDRTHQPVDRCQRHLFHDIYNCWSSLATLKYWKQCRVCTTVSPPVACQQHTINYDNPSLNTKSNPQCLGDVNDRWSAQMLVPKRCNPCNRRVD